MRDSLSVVSEELFSFNFDDAKKELSITSPSWKEKRNFNNANKLVSRQVSKDGKVIHNITYKYDNNQNLIYKGNHTQKYEAEYVYDQWNRRKNFKVCIDGKEEFSRTYKYSENEMIISENGGEEFKYIFNDAGELQQALLWGEYKLFTAEGILHSYELYNDRWTFKNNEEAVLFENEHTMGLLPFPVFAVYTHTPFSNRLRLNEHVPFGEDFRVTNKEYSLYSYCSVIDEIDYHQYQNKSDELLDSEDYNDRFSHWDEYDEDGIPLEDKY